MSEAQQEFQSYDSLGCGNSRGAPRTRSLRAAAISQPFRKHCHFEVATNLPGIKRYRQSSRTCFEGPFGENLRATGPMAKANPFRFSTVCQNDETDLLMYVHRPYCASQGRFLSRDPIAELGGMNLFAFVGNSPLNKVDHLGLAVADTVPQPSVWDQKFNIQKPGGGNAVTTGFFKITVNTVNHSGCCCKLANATYSVKALTQFQGSSWNYNTVLHEGVHAWADWQMGEYAITTWIYQHTRCCIFKVIESPADCKKALEESAKKLEVKLDDLANSQTSVLGTTHHALIGTVGWSQAGEDAFVAWFSPWLNTTFPGGCLDPNGFHCRDVK